MALQNKLNITSSTELANSEEKLTKIRALELFSKGLLNTIEVGTFKGLCEIHQYLFQDIYDFAGQMRTVNIAKGQFRFAPVLYLEQALQEIDNLPYTTFEEILAKYVEMNVAHPFREGNGRAMRIWLDCMLKASLGQVIDWQRVHKQDYLSAMERSPINDLEIRVALQAALTDKIDDRLIYMKGIDASYAYEGYDLYQAEQLES